jgi:hypothetical protein
MAKNMINDKDEILDSVKFPSVIEKKKENISNNQKNDSLDHILKELELER